MKLHIADAFQDGKFGLPFRVEGLLAKQVGTPFHVAYVLAEGLPKLQTFQVAWLFRLVLNTGWNLDFSSACAGGGQILPWHLLTLR